MKLLEEIGRLKHRAIHNEFEKPAENPLPRVEAALREVSDKMQGVAMRYGLSWPELVMKARGIDNKLTERVLSLLDEIDTDIYGRYLGGRLTHQVIQDYITKLDEWKSLSLQLFDLIRAMKHESM